MRDITQREQLEKRLEAIYQLGRELTLLYDETAIIQRVLNTVADVLQFEMVGCGLVDEEAGELEYRHYLISGLLGDIRLRLPLTGPEAQSIGAAAVREEQAIMITDTHQDTRYIPFLADWPSRSGICVPLKTSQRVIGVLNVESLEPNYFSLADQQLLQTLADQAAIALENAHLFKAEQRQREIATILAEVVASVSLNLSTDELLDQILLKLQQLLAYDSASIFLIEGDQLVIEAKHGFEHDILVEPQAVRQNVIFQEMVSQRNYILIPDTLDDTRYQRWQGAEKVRAWVGAPLVVAQEVIGYLAVDRHLPGALTTGDADLIQAFAHQVAQTIYNARLFADLKETRAQLIQRERLAALGQMAATLAHELRNPLMVIQAGVEDLLYDVGADDTRWQGAALMRANIARIDRIIEDILFIARAPRPILAPTLLRTVIETQMARWNLTLTEKKIHCHLQLADNLPPILLDADQMGRAFSNLISNCVDVLPPGGELRLTLGLADNGQITTLADNGPGISPEHLPQIFEPFFTTKSRGSGLGLSIVKQIIDYHQGEITVWSEIGVGTRFTITLPQNEPINLIAG